MSQYRLSPLAAIGLSAAIVLAQESATSAAPNSDAPSAASAPKPAESAAAAAKRAPIPRRVIAVKATPIPVATPIPKKAGFWERVFGKPKAKPTPIPATPKPTPVFKKKLKPRATRPKPTDTNSNDSSPKMSDNTDTKKADPEKTEIEKTPPARTEETVKPTTPKPPKTKGSGKVAQDMPPTTDNADAEVLEKQKYDQAKAKAATDPKVQELRGKADLAGSEEESRKALRSYNKAMFQRMKEIDPSIKDHISRMESAVMSRLGE